MTDAAAAKRAARAAALAARSATHAAAAPGVARWASGHALEALGAVKFVRRVSAYLPFRDEIDPRPLMLALHGLGLEVCLPVIEMTGQPLRFRAWQPGTPLTRGRHGIDVPAEGDWVVPELLFVPLVAFDDRCHRLGYGGGYYDRTLAALREASEGEVRAYGFAYAGQRVPRLPREVTDAHLDAVITEAGIHWPQSPEPSADGR